MALYKYSQHITVSADNGFDTIYSPGTTASRSGIYRCEGCGKEIAINGGNPLPLQNHHQHTAAQGTKRWRMIVCAQV